VTTPPQPPQPPLHEEPPHPPLGPHDGPTPDGRWQRFVDWLKTPMARFTGAAGLGGLVLGLVIGLCAGGGDNGSEVNQAAVTTLPPIFTEESTTTSVAPAQEGSSTTTTQPVLDRNPLTGEVLAEPASGRIIAVKVDNVPAAQPQIGIGSADMVMEVPIEGGLTRFTALYFGATPPTVGPVRSVRPVDADLLAPFRPVLVATGGQDFVLRLFEAADIPVLDLDTDGLYGVVNRPEPQHIVALLEFIDRFAGDEASPAGPFPFTDEFVAETTASSIMIPYSAVVDVVWRFEDGRWVRAQNGETAESVTSVGGAPEPVTADTIVVLEVAERSAGYFDTAGTEVTTYDVIGFGDARVFHDGRVIEGRWLRASQEDPWVLLDDSGARVALPPGRMFVEIVPRFVEVTFS